MPKETEDAIEKIQKAHDDLKVIRTICWRDEEIIFDSLKILREAIKLLGGVAWK